MTRIVELASIMERNIQIVNEFLSSNGLATPSFDVNGPFNLSIKDKEVEKARATAVEASIELQDLLQGPRLSLRPTLNIFVLQAIYKYNIASHVPLTGSISFTDLAAKIRGLSEPDLRRIVRFAAVFHRVFTEPVRGFVAHTAASRLLLEDPLSYDSLGYQFEEMWQAVARTMEARDKWDGSTEPQHSGFSLAMGTGSAYDYFAQNPDKARRFGSMMQLLSGGTAFEQLVLATAVRWDEISGLEKGRAPTLVDVGGSRGHISVGIAKLAPELEFVVQDLPETIEGVTAKRDPEMTTRIKFQAYNFLTEQPVKGAEVYLFSHIFHNWSDEQSLKILRNQVPALKKGAKLVINDVILPDTQKLPLLKEREVRAMDMVMMSLFNAREREQDDWIQLIKKADERFADIRSLPYLSGFEGWCN